MTLLESNLAFAPSLALDKQTFYVEFCTYCFDKNILFKVLEGKRSYGRQCILWTSGRTRDDLERAQNITRQQYNDLLKIYETGKNIIGGQIITWTINSNHLRGLAFDLQPLNCKHSDIELLANRWGITHPLLWDQPHYELIGAHDATPEMHISPETRVKNLERRLENEDNPITKNLLSFVILRLKKRLSIS